VTNTNEYEIKLITNTRITELANICKIRNTSIDHGIFHKLLSSNSWLFTVIKQNLIITCLTQKPIIIVIKGSGIVSLAEQCSATSEGYRMTPFRTIYSDMNSDFIPNVNLIQYRYKNKEFLPSEYIFSHEEKEFVTLRNEDNKIIWINISLFSCTLILLILIIICIIFKIYKRKRNINQPGSTEQIELKNTDHQGKSLPKIII